MRIAIIDHSYHRTTKSNAFFRNILSGIGTVTEFFDETWRGGENDWRLNFDETCYDLIVIWQAHETFEALSGNHNNVVFVPMYDGMLVGGNILWRSEFKNVKCVSFCRKLHFEISKRGGTSRYFKYFPDPSTSKVVSNFSELRPLFWYRTNIITADIVLEMCKDQKIRNLTIHNAPDPGQKALSVTNFPSNITTYEITRWFAKNDDYRETLLKHNVFFAPRDVEGIGLAFLEAMASGLCVVAPNMPTMSEYISNGTNGILYPLERRFATDFTRVVEMGARARETMERGFSDWQQETAHLVDYLITPKYRLVASSSAARCSSASLSGAKPCPKISVVTVCLNAAADLEKTIESVLGQDRPSVEYIILDGGSTDGSVEVIKKFAPRLAYWHSAPSNGTFDAMNDSVPHCSGEWILFMNAGDTFSAADSLSRMYRHVPSDADVVYGHHFYIHADGFEDYRPVADFETTWARLQRGELWLDWLAGIPVHQATAVRRDLLARLRFDTDYRIAADHDLLFRARKDGARFFNCDELVSACMGGGMFPRNFALRKREWARIARNHGDPAAADLFFKPLATADMVDVDEEVMLKGAGHANGDNRKEEQTDMSAGKRHMSDEYITRRLAGHYDATPEEGIDFKRRGMPTFIADCTGVSYCEDWGRWTDGDVVMFRFDQPLAARFDLEVTGFVLAPNVKRGITVRVGSFKAAFRMTWPPAATLSIRIKNDDRSDTVFFDIPNPTARAEDRRRLGIALLSLKIKPPTAPLELLWRKLKSRIGKS
jgi:glycosyltransferase involved in cell wall biosynthesis